ncbi:unnamed protein product [Enterobius vermicularis]|uniref:Transposase n=1 Tax=Enterobius vermicularis TaxID=51028 RepID=A0A0N4V312_ENTVE|nr:unnamed protein product [Enterobius vermicularis]
MDATAFVETILAVRYAPQLIKSGTSIRQRILSLTPLQSGTTCLERKHKLGKIGNLKSDLANFGVLDGITASQFAVVVGSRRPRPA